MRKKHLETWTLNQKRSKGTNKVELDLHQMQKINRCINTKN